MQLTQSFVSFLQDFQCVFTQPSFGTFVTLMTGWILSHRHRYVTELIQSSDADFVSSGLHRDSVIRLSYLYAADGTEIAGAIGSIDPSRLQRLQQRLADHLKP